LNRSFFPKFQLHIAGKQRHDDRLEEPDRVLGKFNLERLGQHGLVFFGADNPVEGGESGGSAADGALWAAGVAGLKGNSDGCAF